MSRKERELAGLVSRDFHGHRKKVHSVAWSANGERLASGSVDQTARVWSVDTHRAGHEHVLKGHSDSVEQLAWHPTHAATLASAASDRSVRLWDVGRSSKAAQTLSTSGENINVAWRADGQQLAVGNKDDLLTFFDVRSAQPLFTKQFAYQVNEFAWAPADPALFFLTTDSGAVELVRLPDFAPVHSLRGHTAIAYCLALSRSYLACGSADALVSLWSLDELVCVRTFSRLEWPVRTLSFSHCGRLLASASEDLFIDVSSVDSGDRVVSIPTNCASNSVAWSPKKHLLAFAGDEKDRSGYDTGAVHVFGFPAPKR